MSLRDYHIYRDIAGRYDVPEDFYGVVMALMSGADTRNLEKLKAAWPHVYEELVERYNAPGGLRQGETSLDGKTERRADGLYEDGRLVRAV